VEVFGNANRSNSKWQIFGDLNSRSRNKATKAIFVTPLQVTVTAIDGIKYFNSDYTRKEEVYEGVGAVQPIKSWTERSEYHGQTSLRSPKAHWISATCYVHLPHPIGDTEYCLWQLASQLHCYEYGAKPWIFRK